MKICWDNIEDIRLTKRGNFRDIIRKITYYYFESCDICNDEFFGLKNSRFCSKTCKKKGKISKITKKRMSEAVKNRPKISDETRKKLSNANKGRKFPDSFKKKMSEIQTGENNSNWKGGYSKKGIPTYNLYAHKIEWCEEVRRNEQDPNILEVKCFKCDEWFVPVKQSVIARIQHLNGNTNIRGERRFYCSNKCRKSCSIFNMRADTLIKRDTIRAGRLSWLELTREVQPELRSMVLERDKNQCIKCKNTDDLQCHHILPVNIEPLLSADVDNCITLCKKCHVEAHKKDGCRYNQLDIKEC
jgi:hypothetical protein